MSLTASENIGFTAFAPRALRRGSSYTGAQCNGSICCRISRRCACSKKSSQSVPEEEAVGWRLAKPEDFYFQGHFPQDPIVPAIILVEMVAQVGRARSRRAEPGEEPRTAAASRGGDWSVQISRAPRDQARASKHRPAWSADLAASTRSTAQSPLTGSSSRREA